MFKDNALSSLQMQSAGDIDQKRVIFMLCSGCHLNAERYKSLLWSVSYPGKDVYFGKVKTLWQNWGGTVEEQPHSGDGEKIEMLALWKFKSNTVKINIQ